MIKIATPISTLFDGGEAEKRIVAQSDCLECRDHTVASTLPNQELFHFEAELIHEWDEAKKAFIQASIAAKPDLQLITFHAASCCSAPVLQDGRYQMGGTEYTRDQLIERAEDNVDWLRSVIPAHVHIGIENNNYYDTPAYKYVTDGDFLSEIVDSNGLVFLFDIAHAHITAHNKGMQYEEYVASLPLRHVVQLHVCKSGIDATGTAVDLHHAPDEEEFAEARSLLKLHPSIRYLTVEFYRDADILIRTLQDCKKEVLAD